MIEKTNIISTNQYELTTDHCLEVEMKVSNLTDIVMIKKPKPSIIDHFCANPNEPLKDDDLKQKITMLNEKVNINIQRQNEDNSEHKADIKRLSTKVTENTELISKLEAKVNRPVQYTELNSVDFENFKANLKKKFDDLHG